MNATSFSVPYAWPTALGLAAHIVAGVGLGTLYYTAVWWSAQLFGTGGRTRLNIALIIGRIGVLGGLLFVASLEGAVPLLTVAVGVLIARPMIMRALRGAAT